LNKKGIGLGLCICKMISKEFNGDIYVLSEYGQGSIFTFEMEIEKNLNTTISEESIAKN